MRHLIWIAVVVGAVLIAVIMLPAQISFHEELNQGVQAYKAANYDAAAQHSVTLLLWIRKMLSRIYTSRPRTPSSTYLA